MNETTKARQYWGKLETEVLRGKGIDIGCGPDPVNPDTRRFDMEHGDANCVSQYIDERFDYVYSSHCLEHMHQPAVTILDWWKLVKPGGHLFVLVPDEDLYEQGVFPSRFNDDHKATFTISKSKSWSSVSHNVLDLGLSLPNGKIVSLELQDRGYDRCLMSFGRNIPGAFGRIVAKGYDFLSKRIEGRKLTALRRSVVHYFPLDQTTPPFNAQAQIQLIVKKLA